MRWRKQPELSWEAQAREEEIVMLRSAIESANEMWALDSMSTEERDSIVDDCLAKLDNFNADL